MPVMNKILSTTAIAIGIGAAAFGVSALGPVAANAVGSAAPATSSSAAPAAADGMRGRHPLIRARFIREAANVAADKIGVSVSDLRQSVRRGKSIATVATDHGVKPDDVKKAIVDDISAK